MIKIELTETYGGFEITGNYEDFKKLDDAFNAFLVEPLDVKEQAMASRLEKFIITMRDTYQEKPTKSASFRYCLPELIVDIMLYKYFAKKNENKALVEPAQEIASFYKQAIILLECMVSKRKYAKICDLLIRGHVDGEDYVKQWYDRIIIKYLDMALSARQARLAKVVEGICVWEEFSLSSYEFTKEAVKNYVLEHNCTEEDVVLEEYPNHIDW